MMEHKYDYKAANFPEPAPEPDVSLADSLPGSVDFDVMAFGGQATVCSALPKQQRRSTAYQSEAQLEDAFIKQLCRQGYERLVVSDEADLVANLRAQLEALNRVSFTDGEWNACSRAGSPPTTTALPRRPAASSAITCTLCSWMTARCATSRSSTSATCTTTACRS